MNVKPLRLSASQVNLFLNEPALWGLRLFRDLKTEAGPGAWRGKAVEAGLADLLFTGDIEAAQITMYKEWGESLREYKGNHFPILTQIDKEKKNLEAFLDQAYEGFKEFGKPKKTQLKVEWECEGVEFIGYVDFAYEDIMVDAKSTNRCPSSNETMSIEHIRQVAIYQDATGVEQALLYHTPKKFNLIKPTPKQLESALTQVKAAVRGMKAVASLPEEQAFTMYPPKDVNSYLWDDASRAMAAEIWGVK